MVVEDSPISGLLRAAPLCRAADLVRSEDFGAEEELCLLWPCGTMERGTGRPGAMVSSLTKISQNFKILRKITKN